MATSAKRRLTAPSTQGPAEPVSTAEGLRVLEEGPLRKDEPGRGDVLSEQAQAETEPAEPY